MKAGTLWSQIAETSGATIATVVASAFMLVMTAHTLGPDGRGVYAAATAWVMLFAALGSLSLGQVTIYHVAGRPSEEWLAQTAGTLLGLVTALCLLGWMIVAAIHVATGPRIFHVPDAALLVAFLSLPFALALDSARYLAIAAGRLRIANHAQILAAIAGVVATVVMVVILRLGVIGALSAFLISSIVAPVYCYGFLRRIGGRFSVDQRLARVLLTGAGKLHWNVVGNYLFTQASVLILNYYRVSAETAYYQLATQLFSITLIVSSSAGTVSFGLVSQKGPDVAWPEQRQLMVRSLLIVSLLAVIGYFLAPLGIRLAAGEKFMPAVGLFRMLLPALPGATFSMLMASQWIGRGMFKEAAIFTVSLGVVSLAIDFYFIPRYGMRGALVSTLVTYGLSVVGNGIMALWVQRRWKLHAATAA